MLSIWYVVLCNQLAVASAGTRKSCALACCLCWPVFFLWPSSNGGHRRPPDIPLILSTKKRPEHGSEMTHYSAFDHLMSHTSHFTTVHCTKRPEGWSDSTGPHDAQSITEVEGRASPVWGQHIVMFSRRPPSSPSYSRDCRRRRCRRRTRLYRRRLARRMKSARFNEMYERWCQKQFLCLKTSHFSYISHKIMFLGIGNWMMIQKKLN